MILEGKSPWKKEYIKKLELNKFGKFDRLPPKNPWPENR